jgi:hypothetical protein
VVACGIDAIGTYVSPAPERDAETDSPRLDPRDGSTVDALDAREEGFESFLDAEPIFDAALDVNPLNCLKVCEAGTCNDAGACVIRCDGTGTACPSGKQVVCPPGVPCDVRCTAQGSCDRGVDCSQASRCNVLCSGQDSCLENEITCTGDSCVVSCSGQRTCNRSVVCDAGNCILRCTGDDSCLEHPVECYADSCTVQCGITGGTGQRSCNRSVTCVAKDECKIGCFTQDSCLENPVRATADRATVTCSGQGSCNRGVVTSAGDSGIVCKNQDSCAVNGVNCDGGNCRAICDSTGGNPIKNCCKATTCVAPRMINGCTFTTAGCPP